LFLERLDVLEWFHMVLARVEEDIDKREGDFLGVKLESENFL
jgi:hypothetical protein